MDVGFAPRSDSRAMRGRKALGRRRKSEMDQEYAPDGFVFNPNDTPLPFELPVFPPFFSLPAMPSSLGPNALLGGPSMNITPTSASPRSAHSESVSEDGSKHSIVAVKSNDLDSLVSAALAANDEDRPASNGNALHGEPMVATQVGSTGSPQQQQGGMVPWPMQVPMMPYGSQGYPAMMGMVPMQIPIQVPLLAVQWRVQGAPVAPITLPVNAAVRDLLVAVQGRLQYEHGLQLSDRVLLVVTNGAQQRFPIDEQTNPNLPLHLLGLHDPSTILDVTKYVQ